MGTGFSIWLFLWISSWSLLEATRSQFALSTSKEDTRHLAKSAAPGPDKEASPVRGDEIWEQYSAWTLSSSDEHRPAPRESSKQAEALVTHSILPDWTNSACTSSLNKPVTKEFVTTRKGQHWFYLGDSEFHFAGTNAYYLLNSEIFSDDDVLRFFCLQGALGAKIVRFFAFLNGNETSKPPLKYPLQPKVGYLNLTVLRRLDLIVAEASKNGVRLIMVMGNFENAYGGIQWYVDNVLSRLPDQSRDKEFFYTSPSVKHAYKRYLQTIITRKNPLTGVAYCNDSTIMAWELLNEPHTSDLYERNNGTACRQQKNGCHAGRLVFDWLAEMSTFVKGLDSNHLVSSGEEGYKVEGPVDPPHNNWLNGGFKGVDFTRNIQLVDFATIHVYPDNWDIPASKAKWVNSNFIGDRAVIAHKAGKPIIMEEFGMKEGYLSQQNGTRDDMLGTLIAAAREYNYAGTLVWDFWSRKPSDGDLYSFQMGSDGTKAMVQQYQYMNLLSRKSTAAKDDLQLPLPTQSHTELHSNSIITKVVEGADFGTRLNILGEGRSPQP